MFFNTIKSLLAGNKAVSILLAEGADNNLTVTIVPTPKGEVKDAALTTPLSLTATAEELDAEFPALLSRFTSSRRTLEEQVASTEAVIQAATKASADKGAKALSKATPAVKVPPTASGEDDDDDEGTGNTVSTPAAAPATAGGVNIFA